MVSQKDRVINSWMRKCNSWHSREVFRDLIGISNVYERYSRPLGVNEKKTGLKSVLI
ncbi:hypothetical protein SPHINGO8BC_50008 [Sphingobacterium multivorum]|uniref:Uncharacterized protein n=1 Tax=Sphingobacterium multivorum TaxID=28454 RepID=A0A654BCU0_SPHMU|nr:hypothetical protein SPHINGO8BC_50008 [Sphingobacterium multivorum]